MASQEKKDLSIAEAIRVLEQKTEPVVEAKPEPEKAPESKRCPRCAWDQQQVVVRPSEEDLKEYLRCTLAGHPFSKYYKLFDGQLTTKFMLLTSDESNILGDILAKIPREDRMVLASKALRIKLLFYLRQYNATNYEIPAVDADLEQEFKKRFGPFGEDVPVILVRNMMEFTKLSELLTEAGFDRNFWKGAGLG